MLNKRANEASRKAWELEMAIRSVRLAETEMEELRSVAALETELAKHRQVQLA
jgi:hypothetical protein